MMYKVLCLGTLIIDIINKAISRMLNAGKGVNTEIEIQLGGNAYNVSIDLVQLGLLDGHIACLGAVGNDYLGKLLQQQPRCQGFSPAPVHAIIFGEYVEKFPHNAASLTTERTLMWKIPSLVL